MTDIVICADATRTGPGTQPPSPEYKRLETDLNKGGCTGELTFFVVTATHVFRLRTLVHVWLACGFVCACVGAAGHFVYLCYKKGRVDPPISDLYVMGGRNCENLGPPVGFEQIPLDLNIQNWGNWCVTSGCLLFMVASDV